MAISNLVGAAQSYDRPSVFAMAANDNMVKVSSDLLNLAISDFSSFLSKTNDSLQDLRDSSTKTVDGFKKVIRDLTDLDKNIRFKFTYLRKEIESSRNDFLNALKSISFDFAGGEGGEGGGDLPFTETTQAEITGFGPPVIPPVIPRTKPDPNKPNKPDKPGTKPNPNEKPTKKPSLRERIVNARQRVLNQLQENARNRTQRTQPGTPEKKPTPNRPPPKAPAPAINIEIPGKPTARISMAYTPPTQGVSGAGIEGLSGKTTARLGGLPPSYVPAGAPQNINAKADPNVKAAALKHGMKGAAEKIMSSVKGVLGFDPGILGKLGGALNVIMAAAAPALAFERYYNTPENEKEAKERAWKDFQISVFEGLGSFLAGNVGAMVGTAFGGPIGSLAGGILAAQAGGLLGRSLGRSIIDGENFLDALKDELYKAAEAAKVSEEELQEIRNASASRAQRFRRNRDDSNTELFNPYGMTDQDIVEKINESRFLKEEYLKWKNTEEGKKNKQMGTAEWYKFIKMGDNGIGDDNATDFSYQSPTQRSRLNPMSWLKGRDTTETVNVKQGPGNGKGGPAEPDLKGSGLEYQSRQTDPMNMMASYRNMQMDMNPEVYNMSDEVSEGDPNHPTGPMSVLPTADQMGGTTIHAFIYKQSQRDAFGRETNSVIA